jgi:hypothetical protein
VNSVVMPGEAIPLLAAIHHAAVKREEWRSRRRRMSPSHRIDPIDGLLVEFCAEILPDEGLDLYLGQFPRTTQGSRLCPSVCSRRRARRR